MQGDSGKLLVIGDAKAAFSEGGYLGDLSVTVCDGLLEGAETAVKSNYEVVAVVFDDRKKKELATALKVLAKYGRATVVMLVKMHLEPALSNVIREIGCEKYVNDYYICPVHFKEFKSKLFTSGEPLSRAVPLAPVKNKAYERRIAELEKLATTDELTCLKNRRYVLEFARQVIERARAENGQVTLLLYDIDDFKHYNDVYGHPAGDEILKQAAVLMRRCCRSHDVIGRVGGDEFVVVFWDKPKHGKLQKTTERRGAAAEHPREPRFIAERFRKEINDTQLDLLGTEGKGVLTISGGLASYPRNAATVDELFNQADKALLEAKRQGKNRIYLVGGDAGNVADNVA